MGNLIIGLAIGIVVDRYVFPIFDMILETLQYKVTNKCTEIQIDTNLKSLEYEMIANQGNQLTPAIGFTTDKSDIAYVDDEDDEQYKIKIGFVRGS